MKRNKQLPIGAVLRVHGYERRNDAKTVVSSPFDKKQLTPPKWVDELEPGLGAPPAVQAALLGLLARRQQCSSES